MANITKKNNTIKLTEEGGCASSLYGFSFFLAGLMASLFFFSDEHRKYHSGWDEQAFGFTIKRDTPKFNQQVTCSVIQNSGCSKCCNK